MEEKNCRILFEYLRSILYESDPPELDVAQLDKPFQKLGKGLQYLNRAVQEMKNCSAALSRGDLSEFTPSRDNFLCENLKTIHANLNHLTWQAKQVAKGDYSQTVSYLGEFSDAFNTMTAQLREREAMLRQEAQREKDHAETVEKYNGLLLTLIKRSNEDILVTSVEDPRILYSSANNIERIQDYELYQIFLAKQRAHALRAAEPDAPHDWTWEAEDSHHHFFRITTAVMEWQGEKAYAHFIQEVTQEKLEQGKLEQEAHYDTLTQVGNRAYFRRQADALLQTGEALAFCYCDLDRLKYVNDTFGHSEGDWYLCSFVETAKRHIRGKDLIARLGGDEFCLVLRGCPAGTANRKMRDILADFAKSDPAHDYEKSFSCGIVELPSGHAPTEPDTILQQADKAMCAQKKAHHCARA
ncbi:diguanylate cyclase domain-containing protein [Gemmiger sp.]